MKSKKAISSLGENSIDDEELPEGWKSIKICELAETKAGGTPSTTKSEYWDGEIPWINSGALKDSEVNTPSSFITQIGLKNSSTKILPKNTVLIALTGATTGKVGLLTIEAAANQSVVGIIENPYFNSKFLFYFLLYSRDKILNLAIGSAQLHINKKVVDNFAVPLPSLSEQQRIVVRIEALLTHVNAARDRLIQIPLIMKRFRQGVLAAACSGRLTEGWREEHENEIQSPSLNDILSKRKLLWEERTSIVNSISQRKNRQKYKEPKGLIGENIEDLPSCWIPVTISQLTILDVGFSFSSQNFQNSGIRLLRGENIEPGSLRWIETKYWPQDQIEDYQHLLLEKGEIVLGMDRPLISSGLKIARVKQDDLPCLLVQRVTRFKMVESDYTDLLYYNLLAEKFQKYLKENGLTGSALPHITGSAVAEFTLALPSHEEAIEIVRHVGLLFERADAFEQEVVAASRRCERLTQAVLAKAFSGRLV